MLDTNQSQYRRKTSRLTTSSSSTIINIELKVSFQRPSVLVLTVIALKN